MKRLAGFLTLLLLMVCAFSYSATAMPTKSEGLQISLITPPAIRKAGPFPVVAEITNINTNSKVALKKANWQWELTEHNEELSQELEPTGDAKKTVEKLRSKKGDLTGEEVQILKTEHDKLQKGTHYLRFNVSQQMAEEIKAKGTVKLALRLTGRDLSDLKEITSYQEVTLNADTRKLAPPPVAPGAHHSGWFFGDTHSHSTYTWDYLFGNGIYTIPELKSLAQVAGLDWLTLTDHSYCLDPTKYNEQKNIVTSLSDSSFAFLYGEELSVAELVNGVKSYDTAHYNGILNSTFIPSSTDIFRKASSPDSQQGINYLKQSDGLITINHANWGTGSMEAWNFNTNTYPYTHGETGMEVLNGAWSDTNNGSTTRWVDHRLLKGEKVFPFAGSDTESSNHFGECYTVLYADYLTQTNIKDNLALGHQYVTTYPGLAVWTRKSGTTTWSWMGDTLSMGTGQAETFISYSDGYAGMNIYVMKGKTGSTVEQQVYSTTVGAGSGSFTINVNVEPDSYLRVYCVETNNANERAYTAPIWFK